MRIRGEWVYIFTWTGELAVANDVDYTSGTVSSVMRGQNVTTALTAADPIPASSASKIYCQWDTTGASTGAPTFDFHLASSDDNSTYTSNGSHWTTLVSAVLENIVGSAPVNSGPKYLKPVIDINVILLASTETVTLTVYVIT